MPNTIGCEHIHAALRPNFLWQKETTKPMLVVKDDNTNSVGMAVTIFLGLSVLYGIPQKDAMVYLDIKHAEYKTKLKRFKQHIYNGLIRRAHWQPGQEFNTDDRYLMKYEMCKRYIELHYKPQQFVSLIEMFKIV
jgi:hypothetical protein